MSHGTPRIARSYQKLRERGGRDYPSEPGRMNLLAP
jgi:hypothetical protein